MTDADAQIISARLENMEDLILRIESLLQKEIAELKTEQIADLRRQIERIADDQRRLWEAVRALENERNQAHGKGTIVSTLMTAILSIAGSSGVAVFITKWLK